MAMDRSFVCNAEPYEDDLRAKEQKELDSKDHDDYGELLGRHPLQMLPEGNDQEERGVAKRVEHEDPLQEPDGEDTK